MVDLEEFDIARYLNDEATIAEFLRLAQESGDPAMIEATEVEVARAREEKKR